MEVGKTTQDWVPRRVETQPVKAKKHKVMRKIAGKKGKDPKYEKSFRLGRIN
jgi:hypothetical protein